jgi:lipopolysaccharide/colanic/teichoic acid biosynthesis glycosyltransferase
MSESTMKNGKSKRIRRVVFNLIIDFLSVLLSSLTIGLLMKGAPIEYFKAHFSLFGFYFIIYMFLSLVLEKFEIRNKVGLYRILHRFFISWLFSSVIVIISIYVLEFKLIYKQYLFLWLFLIFIFESLFYFIGFAFRHAKDIQDSIEFDHRNYILNTIQWNSELEPESDDIFHTQIPDDELIISQELDIIYNPDVRKFIQRYSFVKRNKRLLVSTSRRFNIQGYPGYNLDQIVNIRKINKVNYINKFFETVNAKLRKGGVFIMCVETLELRKLKIKKKFFPPVSWIIRLFDFTTHRLWPRLPYFRKIYFSIWKNANKRLSYAETLGRLYSCGFEHIAEMETEEKLWLAVRKNQEPAFDFNATYGPIVKLKRTGKNHKLFYVYKFRTMHPFSEFLQEFVYKRNALDEGGKFKNDFRVTTLGRLMRKTWMDELPMLLNLIKGDIKLVGVRPLSKQYFSLYPEEMQKLRTRYKPGLVPPFYYDLPKTFDEIVESERRYLEAYAKNKFLTDFRYFWKAFFNIVFRRARSR